MNFLYEMLRDLAPQLDLILRIVVACICGAAIGYERSVRQKDAGIRTHIIVALGSALVMIVSKYGFAGILDIQGVSWDASRIASNIITGISFLGAGVIFVKNASIKGLTTAAGIWATAGIGIALGAGMYLIGIFSTVLMIIIQLVLHKYLRHLDNTVSNEITLTIADKPESIEKLKEHFIQNNIQVQGYKFNRNGDDTVTFKILVKTVGEISFDSSLKYIADNADLKSIDIDDITL